MAHEITKQDIISTLMGNPRAWHKMDERHTDVEAMDLRGLFAKVGLADSAISEVLLSEALKPEYASLLRADQHKLIINTMRKQIQDVTGAGWNSVSPSAWMDHVVSVVEHVRQLTSHDCKVASIGTVDSGRKLFVSVCLPLGFGSDHKRTEVYLSFLASEKEGYSTIACVDATVVVCGNTYGMVSESNSQIKWSMSHRGKWGAVCDEEVKAMLTSAQAGVSRRIESEGLMEETPLDRKQQHGLLALVLAATEINQPKIREYVAETLKPADISLEGLIAGSEHKLIPAVDLLAERMHGRDLGPDSRVFKTACDLLVSQPGSWGDNPRIVESAFTYLQGTRGHESNQTARANNFHWGPAKSQAQLAGDLCIRYATEAKGLSRAQSALVLDMAVNATESTPKPTTGRASRVKKATTSTIA